MRWFHQFVVALLPFLFSRRTWRPNSAEHEPQLIFCLRFVFCALLSSMLLGCSLLEQRPSLRDQLTRKKPPLPPYRIIDTAAADIGPAGGRVSLGKASLQIPPGALRNSVAIKIQRLDGKSLPPLPPGLMNVTEDGEAYRFLPEDQTFRQDVTVSLPLKATGSARYWQALGVKTYFWDAKASSWRALERQTNVDEQESSRPHTALHGRTRHFTVMINAVLKPPEHAGPQSFNENEISSIGAGDPTANVDLIRSPAPNNQGSANVSFPLRLPAGRGAFSPELALTYSSENGNGPLGVGWDLPISRVAVDISIGVPRYDGTDQYTLNGARLVPITATTGSSCLRLRKSGKPPTLVREYALRIHENQRILLCSGENGNYWEVTERNGVRYYYGVDSLHRIESRDAIPKVAVWLLQEVEDSNRNLTRFTYFHDSFAGDPYEFPTPERRPVMAYLQRIDYTSHMAKDDSGDVVEALAPAYRTELNWDCRSRPDRIVSARFGFLTRTRCRLDSVAVMVKTESPTPTDLKDNTCYQQSDWSDYKPVRCYRLGYPRASQFDGTTLLARDGKTLLARVSVKGADGTEFYHHDFQYTRPEYADVANGSAWSGFSEQEVWQLRGITAPLTQNRRPLGYTNEENHQADLGGGYTFDGCYVGGSTGLGLELPKTETQLIDINGDGIPDRVWIRDNRIRAALGQPSAGGGIHGIGAGETRSQIVGLPPQTELEHQGAFAASQSGSVSCGTALASVNAGMSVSLRLSYSSAFLVDADGDGRVDLLAGDAYHRGLPRSCRDGSRPDSGVCAADDLEVCVDPGNDNLCFSATARSLTSAARPGSNAVASVRRETPEALVDRKDSANVTTPYDLRSSAVDLTGTAAAGITANSGTTQKAESTWGPYTSARRRMEKEGPAAASFNKLRPVLRWDAQHDGVIYVEGVFELRNGADSDGVTIGMYLVDRHGTNLISEFRLDERETKVEFLIPLEVRFRAQIHFVFDPLAHTPISESGSLLDEVDTTLRIKYRTVCPLNDKCRLVDWGSSTHLGELNHHGPTGQLSYRYQYPHDFRTSELPRQIYWYLMPPVGPEVPDPREVLRNQVEVAVRKLERTETPVHVRVRCESVGSQHAYDGHVCPLGTVLQEVVLAADTLADREFTVPLPQPFLVSKPFRRDSEYDCWKIDHDALRIINIGSSGWMVAQDGAIHSFETRSEAEEFRRLLQHYASTCYVGPRPGPQNEVHGFLFRRTSGAGAERSFDDIRVDADCISYSPFSLAVEPVVASNEWLLRSGRTRLMVVSTFAEAEKARSVARNFVSQCFVGRGNTKAGTTYGDRHRDFTYEYFDTPIDGLYDPYRIMVEIDGENGFEIPPTKVQASALTQIVSINRLKRVDFVQPSSLLYKDTLRVLAPETMARTPVRPLFRVHPSRQLKAFRVDRKKWGEKLFIHATLASPKHPLHLGLTGDHFEGTRWEAIVRPEDMATGDMAVSKFYEVTVPDDGLYYLRAFTDASFALPSFDFPSSVHVKAYFEVCGEPPSSANCHRELVPVNLLQADFGNSRRTGPNTNPVMTSHQFEELVGEVAHSFDPFSGGHHGFFYGVLKGNEPITCIAPYGCGQNSPWPTPVAHSAHVKRTDVVAGYAGQDERAPHATVGPLHHAYGGHAPAMRRVAVNEPDRAGSTSAQANEICWITFKHGEGTIEIMDTDSDGDGICDKREAAWCKLLPEDGRGAYPEDGCPDPLAKDSDRDEIPDHVDACPFQPVDLGLDPDSDGCPPMDRPSRDPIVVAPEPVGDTPPGSGGCYAAAGLNTWMCAGGGIHPGHENSSGGGAGFGSALGDGMRRTWTLGLNQSLGASVAVLSASASFGISAQYTDRDVMDWNGDGIVDFVSPNIISLGGRNQYIRLNVDCYYETAIGCLIHPGVRESLSVSVGLGASLGNNAVLTLKTKSDGEVKEQSATAKSSGGIEFSFGGSVGVNLSLNHSATISQRIDLNGDGLPDQIFGINESGNVAVRFNQGYGLSEDTVTYEMRGNFSEVDGSFVQRITDEVVKGLTRAPIGRADTFTRSDPWSVGAGVTIYGFGGSAYYSENDSKSLTLGTRQFADLNGDGLVDIVVRGPDGATMQVAFNMGDYFRAPVTFSPPSWPSRLDASSYRKGMSADFQGSFPARPDPLSISDSDTYTWSGSTSGSFFGFTGTSSYAYTRGKSREFLTLQDMDGDGIPDRVFRSPAASGGRVWVSRGLFGRANLLKTIKQPFGGEIELQYALSPSSEDQPRAKWVLSDVIVDQSETVPAELRGPPLHTRIRYEQPYYDRYEKVDLGFASLTIERLGRDEGETGLSAKRIVEQTYYNRDLWLRGVLHIEAIRDSRGILLKETITDHGSVAWPGISALDIAQCRAQLILPQSHLDKGGLRSEERTPCDVRASRLLQIATNQHEGSAVPVGYRQLIQEYDTHGNVKKLREEYDGANQTAAVVIVDYEQRPALKDRYIVDRPVQITMRKDSETGEVLRLRKAQYDDNGNLTRHEVWADTAGSKVAGFDLEPDQRGYVAKVTDSNGFALTFTADAITGALTTKVEDSFGLFSTSNPDLRFQLPLDTTDVNGNTVARSYDHYGRIMSARSPYEAAAGMDSVSVRYSASLHANYPVAARTTNLSVDPASGGVVASLDIARFADGLGRIVQAQTQAEVAGVVGRVVSEPVKYDYAGRAVCKGHPQFVNNLNFTYQTADCGVAAPFARIVYDALDRPLSNTTQADGRFAGNIVTRWSYAIRPHPRDNTRVTRQTIITDPQGKIKNLNFDAADRLVAVRERLDDRDLVTEYDYSAASDLTSIRDARNIGRTFEYDLAGRKLAIVTADAGRLEYAYDSTGNLLEQIDTELCSDTPPLLANPACRSNVVRRKYDKNRLTKIYYPSSSDVSFVYGDDDANNRCAGSINTKGRVCWLQDSAGTELTSFGALGEVLRSRRTVAVSADPAGSRTYDTTYLHDSFGRLLRVTYPDGEALTYGYDAGARVNSAIGERNGARAVYVADRLYDMYGKPLSTTYGNGVSETNEYYPNTQRLHRRFVHKGNVLLSGLELTLDKVGNISRSATERGEGHAIDRIARSYTYDDLHRLDTFILNADGNSASLRVSGDYDYDDVGNITRQQLTHAGSGPSITRDWAYTYDRPSKPNLPSTIGPLRFSYDNRGALKTYTRPEAAAGTPATSTYHWNEESRLTRAVLSNSESTYLYKRGSDRAWRKVVATSQNGETTTETTHYPNVYYSAWLKRVRPPGCTDSSCESEAANRTKHIRLDGRNVAAVIGLTDPLLADTEQAVSYLSSAAQYIHSDQVQSTSVVTDAGGLAENVFEYFPYGEIVEEASSDVSSQKYFSGFNGMELDLDIGLQYFGARYYDPRIARWLSPDPVARGDSSPYTGFGNQPLTQADPDGRQARRPGPLTKEGEELEAFKAEFQVNLHREIGNLEYRESMLMRNIQTRNQRIRSESGAAGTLLGQLENEAYSSTLAPVGGIPVVGGAIRFVGNQLVKWFIGEGKEGTELRDSMSTARRGLQTTLKQYSQRYGSEWGRSLADRLPLIGAGVDLTSEISDFKSTQSRLNWKLKEINTLLQINAEKIREVQSVRQHIRYLKQWEE